MEPSQVPTTLPEISPAIYGAIGYAVMALLHWASKEGWPKIMELAGFVSERERIIREQAKEGPTMVNVRLELELKEVKEQSSRDRAEHKVRFNEVLTELKSYQKEHSNCQIELAKFQEREVSRDAEIAELRQDKESLRQENAGLREEVTKLKGQIVELQHEAGVWRDTQVKVKEIQQRQQEQQGK